jgi:hypothetical protein
MVNLSKPQCDHAWCLVGAFNYVVSQFARTYSRTFTLIHACNASWHVTHLRTYSFALYVYLTIVVVEHIWFFGALSNQIGHACPCHQASFTKAPSFSSTIRKCETIAVVERILGVEPVHGYTSDSITAQYVKDCMAAAMHSADIHVRNLFSPILTLS